MKHTKKFLALVLSLAVVASLAAAGTLAYLNARTKVVTNSFAVGTDGKNGAIKISLDEAKITYNDKGEEVVGTERVQGNDYKNVFPGDTLYKDPTVHVAADSEDCWLFIGVKNENENLLNIQNWYKGWTKLTATAADRVNGYDVYLVNEKQIAGANIKAFDGVKVPASATDISAINSQTIKVAAYAIQAANIDDFTAARTAGWDGTATGEGGAKAFFAGLDKTPVTPAA